MITTVAGDDNFDHMIAAWVVSRLQANNPMEDLSNYLPCRAIGIEHNSRAIAGAIYHNYIESPHARLMEGTFASDSHRWATRDTLMRLFLYPFQQIQVDILYGRVALKNDQANNIMHKLGFKLDGIVRKGYSYGQDDAVVYSMAPEECRWILDHEAIPEDTAATTH